MSFPSVSFLAIESLSKAADTILQMYFSASSISGQRTDCCLFVSGHSKVGGGHLQALRFLARNSLGICETDRGICYGNSNHHYTPIVWGHGAITEVQSFKTIKVPVETNSRIQVQKSCFQQVLMS